MDEDDRRAPRCPSAAFATGSEEEGEEEEPVTTSEPEEVASHSASSPIARRRPRGVALVATNKWGALHPPPAPVAATMSEEEWAIFCGVHPERPSPARRRAHYMRPSEL